MGGGGFEWVHTIFNWSVHALSFLARLMGISYEEINVWLFCVAWPLVTLCLVLGFIYLWRENRNLRAIMAHQSVNG
jgi:hypothetical protein